jgi:hypothetical protein
MVLGALGGLLLRLLLGVPTVVVFGLPVAAEVLVAEVLLRPVMVMRCGMLQS